MKAGDLTERVILLAPQEQNDFGAVAITYNTAATVWGYVIPERGQEAFLAGRTQAGAQIRVQIRYRDDVDVTWRLKWGGQEYNILYVDRSARKDGGLWITAQVKGAV